MFHLSCLRNLRQILHGNLSDSAKSCMPQWEHRGDAGAIEAFFGLSKPVKALQPVKSPVLSRVLLDALCRDRAR